MMQPQPQTTPPSAPTYDASGATAASAVGSRFVWHDLMSTDPARSLAFYQALLGWSSEAMPIGPDQSYTMIGVDGRHFGGIAPLDPTLGVPSHWIGYLSVEDVDRACTRTAELGGTPCVAPTDIPQVGRFAVVADATGAMFSPFTPLPGQETPPDAGGPPVGAFCWDELLTSDPAAARRFYEALVGWRYESYDMGELGTYWMAAPGDAPPATGMAPLPDDELQAGAQSHWLPYLHVADVDAAAARVVELGGTVCVAPADIPETGRFCVAQEPTGAQFALFRGLDA
jgi:predicted enzyme related to lactoylglutathione lyase